MKYRQLDLVTGEVLMIDQQLFKKNVAALIEAGYEISSISELNEVLNDNKNFTLRSLIIICTSGKLYPEFLVEIPFKKQNVRAILFMPMPRKRSSKQI